MRTLLIAAALLAGPALAQSDTSITTQPATANAASKPLQDPATATAKDAMQPNDTSITTRSSASSGDNMADPAGGAMASAPPSPRTDYPWCSKTVTDGCRQRRDPK